MFTRLRTKLTVLYAALFAGALVLVSGAVAFVVYSNATQQVRGELTASAGVFDRTWELRARQLQDGAALLAGDFGFREAVATGDSATIRSAAENLRARLGSDLAFIVGLDGAITSSGQSPGDAAALLRRALEREDAGSGVFMLDGTPHQAVWAPILSPALTGWVVFAQRLDEAEMGSLERLSAIPLQAVVLDRHADGSWDAGAGHRAAGDQRAVSRFVDQASSSATPRLLRLREGPVLALAKPLRSLGDGAPMVLMLRYSMTEALKPYHPLVAAIFLLGAAGMALLVVGSWMLAKTLTRPISALDEAARQLERGEHARVDVRSRDEIGRLAQSFNTMAAEIRERERRITEDAARLATALDRAEAANRTTNAFLANMSHELRTPLNAVLGFARVLRAAPLEPLQREMVGAIEGSASTLERLLADLMDAAKLQAGGLELRHEAFHLGETVQAVTDQWVRVAAEKSLPLVVDLGDAGERKVLGDAARLQQILGALVDNAVKFTSSGQVRVTVARAAGSADIRFEVLDSGIGFDPALKERLFADFEQADGSSTRRFGGAGLGLGLARRLTELMGGRIGADSRPGAGSLFWVELPLPEASAAPATLLRAQA